MFDIAASYFISFVRLYLNTCITCDLSIPMRTKYMSTIK